MPRRHSWRQNLQDLTALTETLVSTTDLDELYAKLSQRIAQIFGARSCVIALFDPEKRAFLSRSEFGVNPKDGTALNYRVERHMEKLWNFRTQGTLLSNSPAQDERVDAYFVKNCSVKSLILAPMVVQRQVIGLVAIFNKRGKFTEFDSYLASIIAYQTGNILTNAKLRSEERRRIEQIRVLNDLAHKINSTLVLDEILEHAVRAVAKSVNVKELALFMPSDDESLMQMRACTGPSTKQIKEHGYIQSIDTGMIGKCYRTGKTILCKDTKTDPVFVAHPLITSRSAVCIPVKRDNHVVAVINTESPNVDAFSAEDILLLETFADQLGTAITNAMIFESERKHSMQMLLLSELISEISVLRDPNLIVKTAVERIKHRFEYYFIAVGWVDEENRRIEDWYHLPPFDTVATALKDGTSIDNGVTGRAVRTGQTVLVGDVLKSDEYIRVLQEVKSEMAVPVKIGVSVIAVLDLESDMRNAFDESDRVSMETLAHALATAIQISNSYHALERINAQLAETARMKDEIVQIVAHDFRSPLTVIRGYMDHLLKKEEWKDERQREIMEIVSAQAQRLQRLAEATLKASRLDSGDLSFSMEKIDFQSFLQRLIFPWSEKHTFVMQVQPDLPLISADAGRLQEVMENLLSNAIKYSPAGGQITIQAKSARGNDLPSYLELSEAVTYLVVSVSDEGIGIPQEKRDLLFRRFTRLHDMRRIEGIGLGLYIAKKMIDIHGGRIWLEDGNKGATFSFALPGFEEHSGIDTILIIDDDIHTLRMLHKSVTQLGYDVVTATEGKEAMDKLARFHPRLVVLDILMPIMSGDELIRWLRQGPTTKEIPIVVFTGQREFIPSPEFGAIPVVSKNAGVDALTDAIRGILTT